MIYKEINMKHLKEKELKFWNSLVKDYISRENKSFIYTVFYLV